MTTPTNQELQQPEPLAPARCSALFDAETLKRAIAPAWKDCPVGTVAYSHTGTRWTKNDNGWWQANGGDSFPTPGADACLVRLPNRQN